jgi:hypothetical protein
VDVFSLRRDLRLIRSIRVLKSGYHFVLQQGLYRGIADGAVSCCMGRESKRGSSSAMGVSALLVLGA